MHGTTIRIIKHFIIQLMHNIYVDTIKIIKYFKYFIILIVSTYYILCISWIIKCLMVFHLSNSKGQKNRLEMLSVFRMGVQGPLCQFK